MKGIPNLYGSSPLLGTSRNIFVIGNLNPATNFSATRQFFDDVFHLHQFEHQEKE